MPHNRYYSEQPLTSHSVTLTGDEHSHLVKVMRKSIGSHIEVIDGRGRLSEGCITHQNKHETSVELTNTIEELPPKTQISLALGLLKSSHLDTAVEKAIELGVDTILLFTAERSEKRDVSPSYAKRLSLISIAAIKQSGRLYLPNIIFNNSLSSVLKEPHEILFHGDLTTHPLHLGKLHALLNEKKKITIAIGPESGFSDKELEMLQLRGSIPLTLSPYILRAETAAISSLFFIRSLLYFPL